MRQKQDIYIFSYIKQSSAAHFLVVKIYIYFISKIPELLLRIYESNFKFGAVHFTYRLDKYFCNTDDTTQYISRFLLSKNSNFTHWIVCSPREGIAPSPPATLGIVKFVQIFSHLVRIQSEIEKRRERKRIWFSKALPRRRQKRCPVCNMIKKII